MQKRSTQLPVRNQATLSFELLQEVLYLSNSFEMQALNISLEIQRYNEETVECDLVMILRLGDYIGSSS